MMTPNEVLDLVDEISDVEIAVRAERQAAGWLNQQPLDAAAQRLEEAGNALERYAANRALDMVKRER